MMRYKISNRKSDGKYLYTMHTKTDYTHTYYFIFYTEIMIQELKSRNIY